LGGQLQEVLDEGLPRGGYGGAAGDQDDVVGADCEARAVSAECFAQAAFGAVAVHGGAYFAAGDDPQAARGVRPAAEK